ncbi:uncharacterized protein LOC144429615 [Styela clava]
MSHPFSKRTENNKGHPRPSPTKPIRLSDNKQAKKRLNEKRGQSINDVQEIELEGEIPSIPEYLTKSITSKNGINAESALTSNGYETINAFGKTNNSTISEEKHNAVSSLFSRPNRYVDSETGSNNDEKIDFLPASTTNVQFRYLISSVSNSVDE